MTWVGPDENMSCRWSRAIKMVTDAWLNSTYLLLHSFGSDFISASHWRHSDDTNDKMEDKLINCEVRFKPILMYILDIYFILCIHTIRGLKQWTHKKQFGKEESIQNWGFMNNRKVNNNNYNSVFYLCKETNLKMK